MGASAARTARSVGGGADVLFPLRAARPSQPAHPTARRQARDGLAHPRPHRVQPDARGSAVRQGRNPRCAGGPARAYLRAAPARPGPRARGGGGALRRSRGHGGSCGAAPDGQHQRGLRLPVQVAVRSRRRRPGSPAQLSAVRRAGRAGAGAAAALPAGVRAPTGVAHRSAAAWAGRDPCHARRGRRPPKRCTTYARVTAWR
jgi:hypothetical protein